MNVRFEGDCVAKLSDGARWFALGRVSELMLWLLCRHLQGIGGRYKIFEARWAYAAQAAGAIGGDRPTYLASFLKFWAVATSRTSSRAPLKPLSRSRSSLKMRFMWANSISTFLRSWRDCWKASVVARARTRSRSAPFATSCTGGRVLVSMLGSSTTL